MVLLRLTAPPCSTEGTRWTRNVRLPIWHARLQALAQFWKTDGPSELTAEVAFHGVAVDNACVALVGSDLIAPLQVLPSHYLDNIQRTCT
jgi:hypothetical protein